jgi:hypothetical protein
MRISLVELLLRALLRFIGGVGVVQRSLETPSDVVGVLVTAGRRRRLDLAAVLSILEDLTGVLLGLVGRV